MPERNDTSPHSEFSFSEWDAISRRQAISEWRDRHHIKAFGLMSGAIQTARSEMEKRIFAHARIYDGLVQPVKFAAPRIDTELRRILPPLLATYRKCAAVELAALSPAYEALADSLATSNAIKLPEAETVELTTYSDGIPSHESTIAPTLDNTAKVEGSPTNLLRTAPKLLASAVMGVFNTGAYAALAGQEALSNTVQEILGLRDRVRSAAEARIASHWLGWQTPHRTVLQQILDLIEITANDARERTF